MNKQFIKDSLRWGVFLWLIGYILGIILFMLVPEDYIGWFISPIGVIITIWVLTKKIEVNNLKYYLGLGIAWLSIATMLDYLFIVMAFGSDNYYKFDVYLYYILTFALPVIVGWRKTR